ncbi:MAG: hypothetical protein OER91_11365 [Gammaproteobacteria bacterium]|nr:hypothetical protein [Gammaproteobacteria bacterium]
MSKILTLVAFAALTAGCAGNSTQSDTDAAVAQEDGKSEMRCTKVKTATSRIAQKVCKKVEE